MKILELMGTDNDVHLTIEAENPAEIAILKLLNGCDAKCCVTDQPKDGLTITASVKTNKSRY